MHLLNVWLVKDSQRTLALGEEDAGGPYHNMVEQPADSRGMSQVPATAPNAKALSRTMFFVIQYFTFLDKLEVVAQHCF